MVYGTKQLLELKKHPSPKLNNVFTYKDSHMGVFILVLEKRKTKSYFS